MNCLRKSFSNLLASAREIVFCLDLFLGCLDLILGFLFETKLRLTLSITIIIIAWIVVMLVHDTNLKRQLKKFENFRPFRE